MTSAFEEGLALRFDIAEERGLCVFALSGNDRRSLDLRVVRGGLVAPHSGLYARSAWWKGLCRNEQDLAVLRTFCARDERLTLCSYSAAVAWGLPVHYRLRDRVHVLGSHHDFRCGVERHAFVRDSCELAGGLRVTCLEQTVFDCLRYASFQEGLPIADAALARLGMDSKELSVRIARRHKHSKGLVRCLEILKYADGRAESGGESQARAVMIEQGFMLPELQVEIPEVLAGEGSYRVDFFWDLAWGPVIGEEDGAQKYVNPAMTRGRSLERIQMEERLRESRLTRYGKVMRFSYRQILDTKGFCALLTSFGIPRVHEPRRIV